MGSQVEVFWDVTPYSVVVRYQRFGGPCCLHLQAELANVRDIALDWRGAAGAKVPLANRKGGGSDPAASVTNVRTES